MLAGGSGGHRGACHGGAPGGGVRAAAAGLQGRSWRQRLRRDACVPDGWLHGMEPSLKASYVVDHYSRLQLLHQAQDACKRIPHACWPTSHLLPPLQGLTTASFSSLAWFDKAGGGAFKDANSRLRTAVKDTLVPVLAACLQSAARTTTGVLLGPSQTHSAKHASQHQRW